MLNPILSFSATRRMRSFRTMLVVLAYTAVLMLVAVWMMGGIFTGRVSLYLMTRSTTCLPLFFRSRIAS